MFKKLSIIAVIVTLIILLFGFKTESTPQRTTWWKFQSIDTMKYSRDVSREKLNDPTFDTVINQQIEQIAATGATHVGIATPYDEEFYPILERWVNSARKNNLKVWFRGNWSGWEGWFGYPKITREEHIKKTKEFILRHKGIFIDGDVFTACPECENGGLGDPRRTGDIAGHRKFLIDEYKVTKASFRSIGKDVASNFNSMNGDVARVVMNKKTTAALDGIVTIDHYVSTPEKFISDIGQISRSSGGKIVLGEFGAPIPDIHGKMSEEEQALWIRAAMSGFIEMPEVVGLSYWTNTGSSTALWDGDGAAKEAVEVLTSFYNAHIVRVIVRDEAGFSIKNATGSTSGRTYFADEKGIIHLPYFEDSKNIEIAAQGYNSLEVAIAESDEMKMELSKKNEDLIYKILKIKNTLF